MKNLKNYFLLCSLLTVMLAGNVENEKSLHSRSAENFDKQITHGIYGTHPALFKNTVLNGLRLRTEQQLKQN